jgi:hypothetical protein
MFRKSTTGCGEHGIRITAQNFESGIEQGKPDPSESGLKHAAVFSDSEEMNGRKGQMSNLADANPWPPAICNYHNSLLQVRQYSKPCSHH